MPTTTSFPDGFLWGTATAAHQVEGGNWNNDWWAWEHAPGTPCPDPSGDACDHWHRYDDDIALVADLGFNAYRFSLEWSRIEPEEGEFSLVALDHYKRMCESCLERGVEPVVTFHHFTSPRWVAAAGGWAVADTADRFARFVERAASHLHGSMAHHLLERTIVPGATWHVDWQGRQAIDHLLQRARHVDNDDDPPVEHHELVTSPLQPAWPIALCELADG